MKWQCLLSFAITLSILVPGFTSTAHSGEVMQADSGIRVRISSIRELRESRVVIQKYDFSCGSAAVATLLKYSYGTPVTEEQVFKSMYAVGDQAHIRQVGFSLLDMQKYLAKQGIHSDGYKVTIDQLRDLRMPAITLISPGGYNHFVVLRGWEENSLIIADPQRGLRRVPVDEFEPIWNGVVFVLNDNVATAQLHFNDPADLKILPRAAVQTENRGAPTNFILNLPALNEY